MEYAEILHRCFRCGYCKLPGNYQDLNCPSYLNYRFETFSPGGRLWLLRGWLDGEIQTTPRLAEILYSCATCGLLQTDVVDDCAPTVLLGDGIDGDHVRRSRSKSMLHARSGAGASASSTGRVRAPTKGRPPARTW